MSKDVLIDISTRLTHIASNNKPRVYYKSKLPNSIDDEVRQICEIIMSLTPEQRNTLISSLANEAKGILWGFGVRMTMLSVRQNSVDELLKGLVGFILAAVGEDYRDILVDVSLFYKLYLPLSEI